MRSNLRSAHLGAASSSLGGWLGVAGNACWLGQATAWGTDDAPARLPGSTIRRYRPGSAVQGSGWL